MTAPHRFDLTRIGAGLVVAEAREALERAAATGAFVVTAPPGTGKTTFVPPLIANLLADRAGASGRVLLTQPRRVAVRAAAARIAALDGSPLGGSIGFTVRGERRVSADTHLEVLTPGVLLRRLLGDPEQSGVGAVILDEVHERSVDGDLLLGMLAEVRELRPDLLVVAMSATLDATRVAELLGGASGAACTVVEIPSALHPLDIAYAPFSGARLDDRGVTHDYLDHLAAAALTAHRQAGHDALVFVPGAREVDEVVRRLRSGIDSEGVRVEALPLHGRIPADDQDRAVAGRSPGEPSRIIVSTSLAESSLTVPGVRLVVDSGLAREVRRDRGRDMTGLVTVSASRASAEQRAGRAARLGPGRAVRVYSETEFARMPAASAPEIASADLVDAALLLSAWGTPGGSGFPFLTPPPAIALDDALRVLRSLGLIDDSGLATALGSRIAVLPAGAREARALLSGSYELGDASLAAEVVAAVSDDHREAGADLTRLLRELRSGRAHGARRWKRETERLARIAQHDGRHKAAQHAAHAAETQRSDFAAEAAATVVALARPERIARRTGGGTSRSYLLASGTRAALPENSGLIGSRWLAVHEVQRAAGRIADGTGAVIRLAAPISESSALRLAGPLVVEERTALIENGRVRVREEKRLGAIPLASSPVSARPDDSGPAFASHLREVGLEALRWSDTAAVLRARLALLRGELGSPWPAVDDDSLLARIDDWLMPDLARLRPDASLHGIDVGAALRRLLPWPEAARLDELVPERLAVPSGSTARIDYPGGFTDPQARPVVAVKLQEVFGLARTPRIVDGRVPVLFHLLSPARRPLAVTADLESFWDGPYQEVRREMRGRYPKHPWPEDPWTAQATARTKHPRR